MLPTNALFEELYYANILEDIGYFAVINNESELVKSICCYIDDNYSIDFEELDENITSFYNESILFEAEWNPKLSKNEEKKADTLSKYAGKSLKNIGKSMIKEKDFKLGNRSIKGKGILRRATERIGKSKVGKFLSRGIKKGLQTKLGQKVVGLGIRTSKRLMKSGGRSIVKGRKSGIKAVKQEVIERMKKNKGGWKERLRQGLKKTIPVAAGLGATAAGIALKNAPLTASGFASSIIRSPDERSAAARRKVVRGGRRAATGKALYNKFKSLKK